MDNLDIDVGEAIDDDVVVEVEESNPLKETDLPINLSLLQFELGQLLLLPLVAAAAAAASSSADVSSFVDSVKVTTPPSSSLVLMMDDELDGLDWIG